MHLNSGCVIHHAAKVKYIFVATNTSNARQSARRKKDSLSTERPTLRNGQADRLEYSAIFGFFAYICKSAQAFAPSATFGFNINFFIFGLFL
ncbi:MAG: hypothetical protein LBH84_05810 [Prevotellaceae bacterium]|jgi:hypothetical protein|nr:hypothetical protein [Prevotellaceae bacterium]